MGKRWAKYSLSYSEKTLANYVKGRTDIGGMSFDKVIKITAYYISLDNGSPL